MLMYLTTSRRRSGSCSMKQNDPLENARRPIRQSAGAALATDARCCDPDDHHIKSNRQYIPF